MVGEAGFEAGRRGDDVVDPRADDARAATADRVEPGSGRVDAGEHRCRLRVDPGLDRIERGRGAGQRGIDRRVERRGAFADRRRRRQRRRGDRVGLLADRVLPLGDPAERRVDRADVVQHRAAGGGHRCREGIGERLRLRQRAGEAAGGGFGPLAGRREGRAQRRDLLRRRRQLRRLGRRRRAQVVEPAADRGQRRVEIEQAIAHRMAGGGGGGGPRFQLGDRVVIATAGAADQLDRDQRHRDRRGEADDDRRDIADQRRRIERRRIEPGRQRRPDGGGDEPREADDEDQDRRTARWTVGHAFPRWKREPSTGRAGGTGSFPSRMREG